MPAADSLVNQRRILFRRQCYVLVSWLVINLVSLALLQSEVEPGRGVVLLVPVALQWSLGALYLVFGGAPVAARIIVAMALGCLPALAQMLLRGTGDWTFDIQVFGGAIVSVGWITVLLYLVSWTGVRISHPLMETSSRVFQGQFTIQGLLVLTTFTALSLAMIRWTLGSAATGLLILSISVGAALLLMASGLILWHRSPWVLICLWFCILFVVLMSALINLGMTDAGSLTFLALPVLAVCALSKLMIDGMAMVVLRWLGYRLEWGRASKDA